MKKICLFSLLLTLFLPAGAQESSRRGYIGLSLGPAFSTGKFASTAIDDEKAGFAKGGLTFTLVQFGYKFHPNIGIAAAWFGSAHPVNADEMEDQLFDLNPNFRYTVEADPWSFGGLAVGLLVGGQVRKMDLDARIMIGYSSALSPEMKVEIRNAGLYSFSEQESALASNVCLLIGFAPRFHLGDKWALTVNADYFSASYSFDADIDTDAGTMTNSWDQPLSALLLQVGAAFRLK